MKQRSAIARLAPLPSARPLAYCLIALLLTTLVAVPTRGEDKQTSESGTPTDPLDWPFWRGPRYDSVSPETGLVDDFDPAGGPGSNVLWKRDDVGTRSTPIVMRGKLYVLARANPQTPLEGERVVCLNAQTGETIWENRFNVWLSDVPDTRVGWSSVVGDPETGHVYALGVCGYFQCLDGETGQTLWSNAMHEYFGMVTTYGGRTNFPVIFEDLVIVSGLTTNWGEQARPAHRLVAFDKRSGEIIWFQGTRIGPYDTNYSSPALATIGGQKQLVFGSGDGRIWSFEPRTGRPLWEYEISRRGLNVSPLVVGDTVYMGHSEENEEGTLMGTVMALDGTSRGVLTKTAEQWRVYEVMMGKSSPVRVGDRLYVVDDRAKLYIMNADTGEDLTQQLTGKRAITLGGTEMRGSPLAADGKLYFGTVRGDWSIWRISENEGLEVINRGRFRGEECNASPICSHGNVYYTTSGAIYCLRDPDKTPDQVPLASEPAEQPLTDHTAFAHIQLVPAEAMIEPGQSIDFRVRLFNARGQLLRETDAEYAVDGPGTIDAAGRYRSPTEAAHRAAVVQARVGDVQGTARVRLIPPLPWTFTFDGLSEPPITWVGARHRHVVRNVDGNAVIVKITTIPKGTRSRCWFGPSHLSDYTIEAEVRGSIANDKLPDIGIIGQGYALDLQGIPQQLQLRSWDPVLRMAKTIDFSWKPDTWYVMKLRVENQPDRAILRGKVWPRDQEEPAEWTLEAVDLSPNVCGSPGLFGNSTDAEITLDNIKVYSN